MPNVLRNIILLKEDCGEVCDTSDNFKKEPGKYFDIIKKEFECDILLTSPTMNPPLLIDEQMPVKENNRSRPPKIFDIPKEISVLYTFEKRVPFYYRFVLGKDKIQKPILYICFSIP